MSLSTKAYVELVFVSVREIPSGNPAGRAGLKFETVLSGFGFTGGSAPDAVSNANLDLGYIGTFPDGKAPLPGTGVYIAFNPAVACSQEGDAWGIGNLIMSLVLTDRTLGSSSWEITARVWSYMTVEGSSQGLNWSYWSGLAGFDVTDFDSAYDFTLINHNGRDPNVSTSYVAEPLTLNLFISGTPDADPAQAVVNLKSEAESTVQVGAKGFDLTEDESPLWDFLQDKLRK